MPMTTEEAVKRCKENARRARSVARANRYSHHNVAAPDFGPTWEQACGERFVALVEVARRLADPSAQVLSDGRVVLDGRAFAGLLKWLRENDTKDDGKDG